MKRRSLNPKPGKTRLSAGGANRTNLQGVMARYQQQEPDDSLLIPSPPQRGASQMPPPRMNSFQPFQSRLHYPTKSYREWVPHPSYHSAPRYERAESTGLVPRKGLFQNAKYSTLPPPLEIDEEQVRHTEEAIRRIIQKSHQSERFSLNAQPNYQLRDSILRQVYDQGVPDSYRVPHHYEQYQEPPGRQNRPSSSRTAPIQPSHSRSSRHLYSPQNSRYSKQHYRRRVSYDDEEDDYDSDDEEEVFRKEPPPKKRPKKHRYEKDDEEEEEEPEERPESRKRRRQRQRRVEQSESSSDDEANHTSNSKTSRTSKSSKASKSKAKTPEKAESSSPVATGPYIRDTIDRTYDWKTKGSFLCDERGAGIIDRVEAAVKRLPMRDDTTNCYSHVAHMLLRRSMKNIETPVEQRKIAQPQSHLLDQTTSWEHVLRAATAPRSHDRTPVELEEGEEQPEEVVPETGRTSTTLLRDISRLQHPENASTLQIDTSIFTNPRLYDVDVGIEADWMNGKCIKKAKERMPPPLHHSSPVSHDVFKSSNEVPTAPSSIKKLIGGFSVSTFEPDGDHSDQEDSGSEQITGTNFPANPEISFHDPDPGLSFDPLEGTSKSDGHKTMHINSRYDFTIREKRGRATPMVDRDEQEDEEMNREFSRISRSSQQEKYLF